MIKQTISKINSYALSDVLLLFSFGIFLFKQTALQKTSWSLILLTMILIFIKYVKGENIVRKIYLLAIPTLLMILISSLSYKQGVVSLMTTMIAGIASYFFIQTSYEEKE